MDQVDGEWSEERDCIGDWRPLPMIAPIPVLAMQLLTMKTGFGVVVAIGMTAVVCTDFCLLISLSVQSEDTAQQYASTHDLRFDGVPISTT